MDETVIERQQRRMGEEEDKQRAALSGCSTNLLTVIFVCFIRAPARELHHQALTFAFAARHCHLRF